jgi:hypothetical protein
MNHTLAVVTQGPLKLSATTTEMRIAVPLHATVHPKAHVLDLLPVLLGFHQYFGRKWVIGLGQAQSS